MCKSHRNAHLSFDSTKIEKTGSRASPIYTYWFTSEKGVTWVQQCLSDSGNACTLVAKDILEENVILHIHTLNHLRKVFSLLNCSPFLGVNFCLSGLSFCTFTPYIALGECFCWVTPLLSPECQFQPDRTVILYIHTLYPLRKVFLPNCSPFVTGVSISAWVDRHFAHSHPISH